MAKSALVHLYRMSKYDIPAEFADNLKIFMKGMKRHVAAKKNGGWGQRNHWEEKDGF